MSRENLFDRNHPNLSNLGLQLSHSVRALKVWMSVQTFGMAAFRRAVEKGMQLAARADEYVRASPVLQVLNSPTLGIVCFRISPADGGLDEPARARVNRSVLARMFGTPAFMSSTLLHGTFALRMYSPGQQAMERIASATGVTEEAARPLSFRTLGCIGAEFRAMSDTGLARNGRGFGRPSGQTGARGITDLLSA